MATWETDPFFAAAEYIQSSADRLDIAYRLWLQSEDLSEESLDTSQSDEFCKRELITSLGMTKWQLEEFEKAVTEDDKKVADGIYLGEDAFKRHRQFIEALQNQVLVIEKALGVSGKGEIPIGFTMSTLDEDGREELAMFLSGSGLTVGTKKGYRVFPIEDCDPQNNSPGSTLNVWEEEPIESSEESKWETGGQIFDGYNRGIAPNRIKKGSIVYGLKESNPEAELEPIESSEERKWETGVQIFDGYNRLVVPNRIKKASIVYGLQESNPEVELETQTIRDAQNLSEAFAQGTDDNEIVNGSPPLKSSLIQQESSHGLLLDGNTRMLKNLVQNLTSFEIDKGISLDSQGVDNIGELQMFVNNGFKRCKEKGIPVMAMDCYDPDIDMEMGVGRGFTKRNLEGLSRCKQVMPLKRALLHSSHHTTKAYVSPLKVFGTLALIGFIGLYFWLLSSIVPFLGTKLPNDIKG